MKIKIFRVWALVIFLILIFTLIIYIEHDYYNHQINYTRHLFYIPVIISGSYYGVVGGVSASLLSSLSFSPIIFFELEKNGISFKCIEYFLTLFIFFIIGIISGFVSQKINYIKKIYELNQNIEKILNNPNGIDNILQEINKYFYSDICFFVSQQEESKNYIILSRSKNESFEETRNVSLSKDSLIYKLINNKKDFYSQNILKDKRLNIVFKKTKYNNFSLCASTINYMQKNLGALIILKEERITIEDFKLLKSVTKNIAINFQNKNLYNFAITDNLTKAFNRGYFDSNLKYLASYLPEKNIVLAMLDIDFFKRINDTYGHQKGDEVLIKSVEIFKKNSDKNPVCRYGGEEFAIIFSGINKDQVFSIIEKIRIECEKSILYLLPDKKITTVSAGIAEYPKDASNIEELIKKADEALYIAKETGRNRVVVN